MPSHTFTQEDNAQRFNVPKDVKIIYVTVEGAGSGTRPGGKVVGSMRVDDEKDLFVWVGAAGKAPNGKTGGGPSFGGGAPGGDGTRTGGGAWGGGGGSWVRGGSVNGPVRVAAGGAGGRSGDDGLGGRGGNMVNPPDGVAPEPNRGERGFRSALPGDAETGVATGGTLNQGGRGGHSALHAGLRGGDAADTIFARGGHGGQQNDLGGVYGGGGGGGGYYAGGGGAAGVHNKSKGSGGGGGSNFTGGVYNVTQGRGTGGTGDGRVIFTWDAPGGDDPPTAPNDLKINGVPISDGLATRAKGQVTLSGDPNDPDKGENVRLWIRYSKDPNFSRDRVVHGTYDPQDQRDKAVLDELLPDSLYYVRVHTQQLKPPQVSRNYASTSFYTNRAPNVPTLTSPAENTTVNDQINVVFTWGYSDPDHADGGTQGAYKFRYRTAAAPGVPAGEWEVGGQNTAQQTRTLTAGTLKAGKTYDWSVAVADPQDSWSEWAPSRSITVEALFVTPTLVSPRNRESKRVDRPLVYDWALPKGKTQTRADIRIRVLAGTDPANVAVPDVNGEIPWTTFDNAVTGSRTDFTNQVGEFIADYLIEWQVRVAVTAGTVGPWSDSEFFWTVRAPGGAGGLEIIDSGRPASGLGEGNNRVFLYDRGAKVMRGELKGARLIRWGRVRDDISSCSIFIDEFDRETRELVKVAHSWRHELVVFREDNDGQVDRVWEGPITRKASSKSLVEIEAKDPMAYLYRRIMRQGYSDQSQVISGDQVGVRSILDRGVQVMLNALVYDDPNLIDYITPIVNKGDAKSTRVRPDYSRMAWEEIDDMAAVGGLDYTTIGRRIVLVDTHHYIGKLPEMGDGDFSEPPLITEYGMSAAYYYAVTNGSGVWGATGPANKAAPGPEGWIEQLASAYGEDLTPGSTGPQTTEQIQRQRKAFQDQARRNIAGRWPVPILVRVPDNARLSPELQIGINSLVPGVWIPLRADNGIESISQWQKLDSLTCEQTAEGEKVTVVMSPAPNQGQDPDADAAALEE